MDTHRFHIRIPEKLWEKIKAIAERHRRSITQEILVAIECHVGHDELAESEKPPEDKR